MSIDPRNLDSINPPNVDNSSSQTTPQTREGLRIFGKVVFAITSVATTIFATFVAADFIPQIAMAFTAIITLPLTAKIAILAASVLATALAIFGIERLGRASALDQALDLNQNSEPASTPSPSEEPASTPSPSEEPASTPSPSEELASTPSPSEEPASTPSASVSASIVQNLP